MVSALVTVIMVLGRYLIVGYLDQRDSIRYLKETHGRTRAGVGAPPLKSVKVSDTSNRRRTSMGNQLRLHIGQTTLAYSRNFYGRPEPPKCAQNYVPR